MMKSVATLTEQDQEHDYDHDFYRYDEDFILVFEPPSAGSADFGGGCDEDDDEDASYDHCEDAYSIYSAPPQSLAIDTQALQSFQKDFFAPPPPGTATIIINADEDNEDAEVKTHDDFPSHDLTVHYGSTDEQEEEEEEHDLQQSSLTVTSSDVNNLLASTEHGLENSQVSLLDHCFLAGFLYSSTTPSPSAPTTPKLHDVDDSEKMRAIMSTAEVAEQPVIDVDVVELTKSISVPSSLSSPDDKSMTIVEPSLDDDDDGDFAAEVTTNTVIDNSNKSNNPETTEIIAEESLQKASSKPSKRLCNKKIRKQLKLAKKKAAAAAALAHLATMATNAASTMSTSSSQAPPHNIATTATAHATRKDKKLKRQNATFKNRKQVANIAVTCATESIARYKEECLLRQSCKSVNKK